MDRGTYQSIDFADDHRPVHCCTILYCYCRGHCLLLSRVCSLPPNTIVYVFFTLNRSFVLSTRRHPVQPVSACRFFNPINSRDTSSVATKLRHRDPTLPRTWYLVCSKHSGTLGAMKCHVIILLIDTPGTTYTFYEKQKRKKTMKEKTKQKSEEDRSKEKNRKKNERKRVK